MKSVWLPWMVVYHEHFQNLQKIYTVVENTEAYTDCYSFDNRECLLVSLTLGCIWMSVYREGVFQYNTATLLLN